MNTIYIDTNRQNSSVKSNDTNSEWEYRLSNNIQLPAGTEIGIQDVFLHKQGISGATIEIDEDITETMFFSVYLSDNPHWVPKASFDYDNREHTPVTSDTAYTPSFMPFGLLNNRAAYNSGADGDAGDPNFGNEYDITRIQASNGLKHNGGKYYGQPCAAQRVALFESDNGSLIGGGDNPRLQGGEFHNINDPYITGYSEYPMMAIYVARGQDPVQEQVSDTAGPTDTYTTHDNDLTFGAAIGLHSKIPDNQYSSKLADYRFRPYVRSVDIKIKKGVYSIAEIADLIENQINGKYTNLDNDDFYTDTVIDKQNTQTYTGTLETNGIYTKAQAIDRFALRDNEQHGIFKDDLNDVDFSAGPSDGVNPASNYQQPNDMLYKVYSQDSFFNPATETAPNGHARFGPPGESAKMFPNYNPSGLNGLHYVGFNDAYGMPYWPREQQTRLACHTSSTSGLEFHNVNTYMIAYNDIPEGGTSQAYDPANPELTMDAVSKFKGRRPALPRTDQLLYIPVHYYNQLIKMWKYEDWQDRGGRSAANNSYLKKTDNWTVNTRRLFRYGFQTRVNAYGRSTAPYNGLDCGTCDNQIGLHYVGKVNGKPDIIQHAKKDGSNLYPVNNEQKMHIGVSPAQYQYDIFKDGYYVGTPDFSFSYDTDKSAFAIQGLHQSKRLPSADMKGNPMTSEGQECVYVRRQAQGLEDFMTEPKRTKAVIAGIEHAQGTNRDNWTAEQRAYEEQFNTNRGEAGFLENIQSCLSNNEDRVGGVAVYNWAYQTAKKYGDIDPKTYTEKDDQGVDFKVYHDDMQYLWKFQDFFSSEEKAKTAWNKTLWGRLGFTYDNLQSGKSWEKVPYYDLPVDKYTNKASDEALATGNRITIELSRRANTYYEARNKMYFTNEDFVMYGKTTKGDIGVDSVPTISSTFNNLLFQYTEKPISGKVNPDPKKAGLISQVIRTYDNTNPVKPYYGYEYDLITKGLDGGQPNSNLTDYVTICLEQNEEGHQNDFSDVFDLEFSYDNSMYQGKTRVPVLTSSKTILATKLPHLSEQGYFIVTSDIVDNSQDEVKQGQPLPLLSVVPISNLSNQDFITSDSDIVHTLNQAKNINSIKIKILNPDLTPAVLDENSSVILKINIPMPQNSPLTMSASQQVNSGNIEKNKKDNEQEDPRDDKTQSGRD